MHRFWALLLGLFVGAYIGILSALGAYYDMRMQYWDCQIQYSNRIEFQSGFAERLFQK